MKPTVKNTYTTQQDCSKRTSYNEEFGLLREEFMYLERYAIGSYTNLEFKTWKIQHHKIEKTNILNKPFLFQEYHKYIILNMDSQKELQWSNSRQELLLNPNTGIFFNQSKNQFELNKMQSLHFVIIEFKESFFNQSIFNETLRLYINSILISNDRFKFPIDSSLNTIISDIFKTTSLGLCQLMHLNNKMFELLAAVIDFSSLPQSPTPQHPYHTQLEKVKIQINKNLETQFSIETLSKTAGLNTSYLKKYFKESYGITIFEYSQKKRIQYAIRLLVKTKFSIAYISEKVGYQQSAHFSHAFKRNTGLSPNQYRKKHTTITLL